MARQEALALADRGDELARDEARTRAALRRLVGPRADEPLRGCRRWPRSPPRRPANGCRSTASCSSIPPSWIKPAPS